MSKTELIILERIFLLPSGEQRAKFPCAQQKNFVRVVVLLQDKKRDVQSGAGPLAHLWTAFEHLSQSLFKLLSSYV